jgi:hypothetical protein
MRELIIVCTRLKNSKEDWQFTCVTKEKKIEKFEDWNKGNIIECKIFKIELPLEEQHIF